MNFDNLIKEQVQHLNMTNDTNVSITMGNFSFRFPGLIGVLILMNVIVLLENITAMITLTKCKRLVKSFKYFTLNLAVSDALACVFYPCALVLDQIACSFTWPLLALVYTATALFTVFLAIDRCIVMEFTSIYNSWISSLKIFIICLSSWLFSIFASISFALILYPLSLNDIKGLQCLQTLINYRHLLLIHQVSYFVLCVVMFKSCHYILRYISRLTVVSPLVQEHVCQPATQKGRLFLAFLFTAASFLIFSIPMMVFFTIMLFGDLNDEVVIVFSYMTTFLRLFNSLVNPFLYTWRHTECRVRFLLVFCSCNETLRSRGHQMNVREVLGFTFEEIRNNAQTSATQNNEINNANHATVCSSVTEIAEIADTNV